jgi:dihydrolipoamide dehydrogenase
MIFKKRGVEIYTGAMVSAITKTETGLQCHFTHKKEEKAAEADVVLISVGRRPCTAGLFVEGFSVAMTERGFVTVDEQFRTSVPTISAIGDVIGRMQLAHAAEAQGIAAVEYISGLQQASVNYDLVPSCIYTTPEIASVGITADEAKKAGREVVTGKYVMSGNAKTIIEQQERGFVKVVFDKETDVLLGAQLMCARATDLISELITAVSLGLTRQQLARTMRPHPTFCEGITEAVEAAGGHGIHSMPSKR